MNFTCAKSCQATRWIFVILTSALVLSGCGGPEYTVRPTATAHPEIDCRPWPRPPVLVLTDVEPEALADGWKLDHQEYLSVYSENKQSIAHMKGAREVAAYFIRCEAAFNEKVRKMNELQQTETLNKTDDGDWWPW